MNKIRKQINKFWVILYVRITYFCFFLLAPFIGLHTNPLNAALYCICHVQIFLSKPLPGVMQQSLVDIAVILLTILVIRFILKILR